MNLHGAGPASPLHYVAVISQGVIPGFLAQAGYYVMPYGRGNSSYRDIGEIDVLESYDDMHRTFKIDPDRRYLYGFSMGGSGTWRIARRTPDRWAAVAPCGAGGPGVHGPITDHCSPLQFGPAPAGPAMPLAGSSVSPWAAGLSDQVWKAAQLLRLN